MMNRGRGRGRGGGVAVKEWVPKKVEPKPTVITELSSPATAHVMDSNDVKQGSVEVLNCSKYPQGQPASKSTNDHRLSTHSNSNHRIENNTHVAATEEIKCSQASQDNSMTTGSSEKFFDICPKKTGTPRLKSSLLVQNREKRNEIKRSNGGQPIQVLRPGMVLLNNFIPLKDQVEIVQTCRKLGLGNGGFYQPGYGDQANMHLKMMCLGKNWDPKSSSYEERRSEDGAEPPPIPIEFYQLVQKAIQDTHAHQCKQVKQKDVESVLPSMTPDICIVNFYTTNGKLGFHKGKLKDLEDVPVKGCKLRSMMRDILVQDKDESQESLNRGLPVVSISIGDSAEFVYGDQMDIDKAKKVVLESGDVLIFGGKSRHIYHGVTSILPKTAPQALLQESDLRPGRLNLTFRKY